MSTPDWLHITPEVARAIAHGAPVVALESTVIAHGLPRPRNLQVGRDLEAQLRSAGVIPATIAVIAGRPTIGLDDDHLVKIATDESVEKLSTRELPVAVARGSTGATTVAATAHLASTAGIRLFATGGIGGVHRGLPLDISSDLLQLRDSSLIVICAGAKSILNLVATREALEALGVLVLGWRTSRFPGFYIPDGGATVDVRVDSAEEVAEIWSQLRRVGAGSSILLCVPIPDRYALDPKSLDQFVQIAFDRAAKAGVTGKALTPFLLETLAETTDGATLEANVALLRNNVEVAGEVALALSKRDG
ncbi:MAG: pseudouridine-5-phosphate glycosidase [Gemmatimonas sp.]|nr:pseudouridine-5-phosphate glycosidase [Gemmatimonas sp.]